MTDAEVRSEAATLTEDAKHLLLTGEDISLYGMAGAALIMRGLMDYGWFPWSWHKLAPTARGKRIRAYLTENSHD